MHSGVTQLHTRYMSACIAAIAQQSGYSEIKWWYARFLQDRGAPRPGLRSTSPSVSACLICREHAAIHGGCELLLPGHFLEEAVQSAGLDAAEVM
jgi:hypothetical protein